MNRVLKFKIWDVDNRRMFTGATIVDLMNNPPLQSGKIEVRQFSEYRDRYGNEIYEGDILENDFRGITQILVCVFIKDEGFIFLDCEGVSRVLTNAKIIGNIFETPEQFPDFI